MELEEAQAVLRYKKRKFIRIRKTVPFLSELLKDNQKIAVFYEHSRDKKINKYISKYYDRMLTKMEYHGMTFVYAPMLEQNIEEAIHYHFPDSNLPDQTKFRAEDFYAGITDSIAKMPPEEYSMLLIPDYENEAGYKEEMLGDDMLGFYCYDLEYVSDKQFNALLDVYLCRFSKGDSDDDYILFRDGDDESSSCACEPDWEFMQNYADFIGVSEIVREIKENINKLYSMGVSEKIIRQIVALPEPKISRLVITKNFQIILPDYNDTKITMPALSKTIFFFYLRHAEGVLFKHLRDYRDELFDIYSIISPRENAETMRASIDDIVDSTKNSINEKCSRIKGAFISKFQERLSCNYYLTGSAREPKRITLDRSLVDDQSGLIMPR